MVRIDYQYTIDNCGDANTIGSEKGMKTNNNQIIHDMHVEDLTQVENYDEIGFEVGSIREEHETFRSMHFDKRYYGMEFGKRYYYIKSAGIHFPISKDSAEAINAKMVRLGIPDRFVNHGTQEELYHDCFYDTEAQVKSAEQLMDGIILKASSLVG